MMGTHTEHRMHGNSLAAHGSEGLQLSKRAQAIYEYLVLHPEPMTDREIQKELGFAERGMVQPRISDLISHKLVAEVGKKRCELTGKRVRLVQAAVHTFREEAGTGQGVLL